VGLKEREAAEMDAKKRSCGTLVRSRAIVPNLPAMITIFARETSYVARL
jgi:hypothetical protein